MSQYSYEDKEKAALRLLSTTNKSHRTYLGLTYGQLIQEVRTRTDVGVKFVESINPDDFPERSMTQEENGVVGSVYGEPVFSGNVWIFVVAYLGAKAWEFERDWNTCRWCAFWASQ